ncbi:MAG: amidohydrolase family protein [Betaproteobacteria bacterium]|nr:amidohydrolase family protein [Betaproteobacteria bacterium]MBK9605737.1 amidohydrolase family protein [Betaproteobacteria bacterium]
MLDLLITNAMIVDGQGTMPGAIGVSGSRIASRHAEGEPLPAARATIDAAGRMVLPGVVDPHVHFYGEGIGEYSRLAVRGGVTTFIGMIRGAPEIPLATVVEEHRVAGVNEAVTDFSFHVVLYDRPESIAQIPALAAQGYTSFKMFMAYKRRGMMVRDEFLFDAMEAIRKVGGIALIHAEHGELVDYMEQAAVAAGQTAPECYEPTRPAEAEAAAIEIVALAAQATGCPAYIVHLSSNQGLAAVERARRRGVPIWAETCPQYLLLDNDTLREVGAPAKVAPPLRTSADRRSLGTALLTGAVNTVGSDHASFSAEAKAGGGGNIFAAPFGMSGAPTLWPSMFTWALDNGIPLTVLVRAMSEAPARLFGLSHRKGSLSPGADADIIIVDPALRQTVDVKSIAPAVCPNPVADRALAGWPDITISRGEVVWHDGRVTGMPGRAQLITQQRT